MKRGIFHPLSISALFYHVHFSLSRGKWTFRILFSIKRPMEPAPWAVFHILGRRRGDASFCSRSSHAPHGKARFPVHHNIVPDLGVLWIVMRKFLRPLTPASLCAVCQGCISFWGDKTLFEKNTGPHVAKRVGQFCDLVGVDSVDVISVIESVLVRVWSTKVP